MARSWLKANLWYVFLACLITVICQPIYYLWQPLFINIIGRSLHINEYHINTVSLFLSFTFILYNLSIYAANKFLRKKLSLYRVEYIVFFSGVIGMIALGGLGMLSTTIIFSALFLCAAYASLSILGTSCFNAMITFVAKDKCATILSIANMSGRLFSSAFLFLLSFFLEGRNSINTPFLLASFLTILFLVMFYFSRKSLTTIKG